MLKFKSVYRVREGDASFQYIALGVRPRLNFDGIEFIIPDSGTKSYQGDIMSDDGDTILFKKLSSGPKQKQVIVKFEKLNLARFDEMAKEITAFDEVRPAIQTDDQLQQYYRDNFLADFWYKEYMSRIAEEDQ
jgi:hypothetical protein